MKLIAGSILASFGLLVTRLSITWEEGGLGFYYKLNPTLIPAIFFIVGGIGLIGWAIWEARKKDTN